MRSETDSLVVPLLPFRLFETSTEWIAEREVDSDFLDTKEKETSFGPIRYERGIKSGSPVLRRIFYPKEYFPNEKTVLDILATLEENCPLCKGLNASSTPYLSSKQRGEVGKMPDEGKSIFSILDTVTGGAEASRAVGTELLALAIQEPAKYFTTTLGEKIVDFITALGLTGTAVAAPIGHRSKMDALQMGMHFFNQLVDPRPEEVAALQSDIEKLRSAISLGSGNSILNALFKIPTISLPVLPSLSLSVPNISLPNIQLPAGLKLPNLSLSGAGTTATSQNVIPPQVTELGSGVTPFGEVDVSQFVKPDRIAIF